MVLWDRASREPRQNVPVTRGEGAIHDHGAGRGGGPALCLGSLSSGSHVAPGTTIPYRPPPSVKQTRNRQTYSLSLNPGGKVTEEPRSVRPDEYGVVSTSVLPPKSADGNSLKQICISDMIAKVAAVINIPRAIPRHRSRLKSDRLSSEMSSTIMTKDSWLFGNVFPGNPP